MADTALIDIYDALQSRVEVGNVAQLHSSMVDLTSECCNLESRIERLEAVTTKRPAANTGHADYDFEAYKIADQEEKLRIIQDARLASTVRTQQQFFEGMMFADSVGLEQHPEWFNFGCACDTCLSYGDG